jgi:HK97 family phage major capsid protein
MIRRTQRARTGLEFKRAETTNDNDPVAAVERLQGAIDEKMVGFTTELKNLSTRYDAEIARLKRPGTGANDNESEVEKKAFESFLRTGTNASQLEGKAVQQIGDSTLGGYLAPEAFITELLRNVALFSPVRELARVSSVSSIAAVIPRRTGGLTAQWVGELQERPQTNVTFGQLRFPVNELAAYVDVSNSLLEDAAFDINAELAFEFGEEFGVRESAAFVNGSGNSVTPQGFMQSADIGFTVSGAATTLNADALLSLYHAVPTPYRSPTACWGLNSSTLGVVRKLKDGNGQYLIGTAAGLAGAPAMTLLGHKIVEMPDMPDIAAGAFPVVFGDFNQGYRIFDRITLAIQRDPYTQATEGKTRFHARRRVAGGVAKAEALRKLKIST